MLGTERTLSKVSRRDRRLSSQALLFEVLGYGLVSTAALGVDAGILKALVAFAGWHYLLASAVSFIAGAAVAYLLSVRFVFRVRQMRNPALEFGYFVGIGLVGLLVNAMTLSVAIGEMGLGLMAAKLVSALCTFATNFILRRSLLFSTPRTSE